MNEPLFSISMVNYNKADYIEEAIMSVIKQTYSNWELIVIDDGSTDKSKKIISSFVDHRIVKINLHKNEGIASCHNFAFSMAKGELIGILDSDDVLRVDALEKMVELASENPGCGFLYSNYDHCDKDLKILRKGSCHWPIEKGSIIHDRHAVSHFKVFRKDAYEKSAKFDTEIKKAIDRDIVLKMEEVTDFAFIDECLYQYRYTSNGVSTRIAGNAEEAKKYFDIAIENAKRRREIAD